MSEGSCSGSGIESKGIAGTCAPALQATNSKAKAGLVMRSPSLSWPAGFVHTNGRARADAHDLHDHFLVLGAVPVDLVRVMHDEAAGGHGRGLALVLHRSGAHPPGTFEHGDIARLGMEVRRAKRAGREAVAHDVHL